MQSPPTIFLITEEELDLNTLLDQIISPTTRAAAIFSGMVRGRTERGNTLESKYLAYEAYKSIAEAKIKQVTGEIRTRWNTIEGIAIVQRIGSCIRARLQYLSLTRPHIATLICSMRRATGLTA